MDAFENWSLLVAWVTAGTNVVVFGALIWQLRILRSQISQATHTTELDHDRRRKQATIEFYATTLAQLRHLRELLPHDRDALRVGVKIEQALDGDEAASKTIAAYLTLHNLIAISVRSDVFDLTIIDQTFGGRLLALEQSYQGETG